VPACTTRPPNPADVPSQQITESYRDPDTGKPRQRHIANLGRIDTLVEADLDSLIDGLLKVTGRPSLAERLRPAPGSRPLSSKGRWRSAISGR